MSNSSILSIDRILSDDTTPGQSRSGRDGNEGVFRNDWLFYTALLRVFFLLQQNT